jgi:flagellar motility protein MotE (MotC chaperone)
MAALGWVRGAVLVGLACKAVVVGTVWWSELRPTPAEASAPHEEEAEPTAPAGAVGVPSDLLARSRGFRELLEAVARRGSELDEREKALAARATALGDVERTLAAEIARLEALAGAPAGTAVSPPEGEGTPAPLTAIYERMEPEAAAPILDRLDDATARLILARMKQKQVAAILAAMEPERAVQVTKTLLGRDGSASAGEAGAAE